MMRVPRLFIILSTVCLFGVGALGLTGCANNLVSNPFAGPGVNLTATSYDAADRLLQQAKMALTQTTPLQVAPLTDINHPNEITAFGRTVSNQIGARFVQLGFNVSIPGFDEMMLAREQAQGPAGGARPIEEGDMGAPLPGAAPYNNIPRAAPSGGVMITGQYVVAQKDVLVNLRIVEQGSNRILGAYDYSVPLSSDIRTMVRTKAQRNSFFGF